MGFEFSDDNRREKKKDSNVAATLEKEECIRQRIIHTVIESALNESDGPIKLRKSPRERVAPLEDGGDS